MLALGADAPREVGLILDPADESGGRKYLRCPYSALRSASGLCARAGLLASLR